MHPEPGRAQLGYHTQKDHTRMTRYFINGLRVFLGIFLPGRSYLKLVET